MNKLTDGSYKETKAFNIDVLGRTLQDLDLPVNKRAPKKKRSVNIEE